MSEGHEATTLRGVERGPPPETDFIHGLQNIFWESGSTIQDYSDALKCCPQELDQTQTQKVLEMLQHQWTHWKSLDLEVLKLFMEHLPVLARTRIEDCCGGLLLHRACMYNASLDTIQYLIDWYPQAVEEMDKKGMIPLHRASRRHNASIGTIRLLLSIYPDSIRSRNRGGLFPIHCAASRAPLQVIKLLVNAFPDAVCIPTEHTGSFPVHIATCLQKQRRPTGRCPVSAGSSCKFRAASQWTQRT